MTIQQSRRLQRNWSGPLQLCTEPPLYPWMKLAGRWFEHAEFEVAQRVKINVEPGRLTIAAE
ncbi:SymE family type I addiction module toxin [Paraburkholderia azotifigens]|uniref:SymE family type I addiction module toxin n=1 Tax=Paraburkholderia azotifigens TaxID=2057004 RepID=UPI003182192F